MASQSLTSLSLAGNHIRADGAAAVATALHDGSSLTSIDLSNNYIKDEGVERFAPALLRARRLTAVDLRSNHIVIGGAIALEEALRSQGCKLCCLDVRNNPIEPDGAAQRLAAAAAASRSLCHFGGVSIGGLRQGNLQHLAMADASLSTAEVGAVGRILAAEGCSLRELCLNGNLAANTGTAAIGVGLRQNLFLRKLHLARNCISVDGAEALGRSLSSCVLEDIDLSENDVSSAGAAAIAAGATGNFSLKALRLGGNAIGDLGAVAIAKALSAGGCGIEIVDLTRNRISDAGCVALGSALQSNRSVMELGLLYNAIGSAGCTSLARALEENPTLSALNMFGNVIGPDGAAALARALELNVALQKLNVASNRLDCTSKMLLNDASRRRAAPIDLRV